jgi:hypothetical protein
VVFKKKQKPLPDHTRRTDYSYVVLFHLKPQKKGGNRAAVNHTVKQLAQHLNPTFNNLRNTALRYVLLSRVRKYTSAAKPRAPCLACFFKAGK